MSIISNSFTRCQSFVLDQVLVMDDSEDSSIINTIANKCLIPLASLLEKGKVRRFSIDQDYKIEELPMKTKLINPSIAKVLVIFTTVIAVLLKTMNYCISKEARSHLSAIRNLIHEEKCYSSEILKIFGGISKIKEISDISTLYSISDEELNQPYRIQPLFTIIHRSEDTDVFQGSIGNGNKGFRYLGFKYTHFQKTSSYMPPKTDYNIQLYYKLKGEDSSWQSANFKSDTSRVTNEDMQSFKLLYRTILVDKMSLDYDAQDHFVSSTNLPNFAFNYYLGHVSWDEATSIKRLT